MQILPDWQSREVLKCVFVSAEEMPQDLTLTSDLDLLSESGDANVKIKVGTEQFCIFLWSKGIWGITIMLYCNYDMQFYFSCGWLFENWEETVRKRMLISNDHNNHWLE